MATSNSNAAATHEVSLAIYDLSQGMARSLSAQFLGPAHAIDIIPHTAIVIYGREYYFGGGIQSCEPHEFRRQRGIFPIEVKSLGQTVVSQADFESWCAARAADGSFAPESYDLMRRNCNNFSHEAATGGLRLSQGVPDWILGVPERFLSSPMGQMIRPMLENMQMAGPGETNGGQTFGRVPPAAQVPIAAAVTDNPWANAPSPSAAESTLHATEPPSEVKTPVLDSYNRPLLSADVATVSICITKLSKSLADEERLGVGVLGDVLAVRGKALTHQVLESSLPVLLRCIDPPSTNAAFALMLIRLIALRSPADAGAALELKECAVLVGAKMIECHSATSSGSGSSAVGPLSTSHAARSMAWCCLGNAAAAEATSAFLLQEDPALREGLVDAALSDLSPENQPRKEVRQSAVAFAYNVAHCASAAAANGRPGDNKDGEVGDLFVTLLCGALEGVVDEVDPTVKLRRLLMAGKVLRSGSGGAVNGAAKTLVFDLGFVDSICSLKEGPVDGSLDERNVAKVAKELTELLSQ
eukprot:CAMPEP_0113537254 /NCGR_PEP_ID=MMETSP0015_2-20120614/6727_1 /TAXON_ID=2838 /ORGANISM="Odontella" /LENGTH=527 /DNA_ID=CAMNT_0000436735 /DNA_START=51 /DNA_END=1634 /DNA_ORIENTATION=+ /assembly_acc=CAM_ASM_000160